MRIGDGIGDRLAQYRKIRGISAERLSRATGGAISRSVIANIESGRKRADVSVTELAQLAAALGVPPVALLLPIDQPFEPIEITEGWTATVAEAVDWFVNQTAPPIQ